MKKNAKKLRLHRETLVLLDPAATSTVRGRAALIDTSCTEPCDCRPTGCSEDVARMGGVDA